MSTNFQQLATFIWSVADPLRGPDVRVRAVAEGFVEQRRDLPHFVDDHEGMACVRGAFPHALTTSI